MTTVRTGGSAPGSTVEPAIGERFSGMRSISTASITGAVIAAISPYDLGRPVDGWTDLHLRPLLVTTAVLAALMLVTARSGPRPMAIDRPMVVATMGLVAGFGCASFLSVDPAIGLAVTVRVAVLGLVFVAAATVFTDRASQRLLANGVAVGAATASLIGLGVLAIGGDRWGTDLFVGSISVSQGVTRLTRPFSHANVAAMYLAPAAVLIAGCADRASRIRTRVLSTIAIVATVALSLTLSRSGLLALIVGAVVLVVSRRRTGPARWSSSVGLPLAMVLVAVGVGAGSGRLGSRLGPITAEATAAGGPLAPSRPTIWSQAIDAWLDHPLVGVGPGRFGPFSRSVTDVGNAAAAHAHNPILETLATGGVVALAGLGLFAAAVMSRSWSGRSLVPVGLSAAVAAAMLPMVVDNPFLFSSAGNLAALIGGAWYGTSVAGAR